LLVETSVFHWFCADAMAGLSQAGPAV